MGRSINTERVTLYLTTCLLVVIGFLPLVFVVGKSFLVDGRLSFAFYLDLLASRYQWQLLGNSIVLASLTALTAIAIGLPLGILLAKTDLPIRRVLAVLFTVPLLIPPYITAFSWFHLLGREGLLSDWLGQAVAVQTSEWFFGLPGCVLVLASSFLPVVMLLTAAFVRTVHPRLEEAARLVTGWRRVLTGITFRLIAPGVLLGFLLVFLLALGNFDVPMFLRYDVYAVESFTQFAAFYNAEAATAAAVPLALIALVVLAVERRFLRESTYQLKPVGSSHDSVVLHLGRFRSLLLFFAVGLCFLLVILPLLVLVRQSGSLDTYREAFTWAGDALFRSLIYAAIGATVLTLVGFFTGYMIRNRTLSFWRSIDSMTVILFAMPSTVIGIGLVMLWNRPAAGIIYGTPLIIILGYLAKYSALTSRTSLSALTQISPSVEEAARMAGAGWFRSVRQIIAPLMRRGLVAAWLIGYLFCLRDTGLTMMVYPAGNDTLPVRTFTLMANGPPPLIASLCVLMVTATLLPLGVLGWLARSGKR